LPPSADNPSTMDTQHWLIFALGWLLVGVATWIGCWLWYGRKIEALNHRLQKSEKARHFSSQQTLQARKQLEALQKDLAARNAAMAKAQVAKQRNRISRKRSRRAPSPNSKAATTSRGRPTASPTRSR
jgi:hypothetical protein